MAGEQRRPTSFTERVRQELAGTDPGPDCDRRAELAGIAMLGASLHLRGGDGDPLRLEIPTASGAVARRTFTLLHGQHGVRPEVRVESPGGLRRTTRYAVVVDEAARDVATAVGLLDGEGRPHRAADGAWLRRACDRTAFVRGALLAAGSVSTPGRQPHLEITCGTEELARLLAQLVTSLCGHAAGVSTGRRGFRAVLKSREAIGDLLAALGATAAFLEWEERRLRRQLRNEANRLANADAANLRRAAEAASTQARELARAVDLLGWDGLEDDLREVALARLANPSASLGEIGELLDPPVGKSTVHRRLERIGRLARAAEAGSGPHAGDD